MIRFITAALLILTFGPATSLAQTGIPVFNGDPTVHDPSVIRVGGRFYVFGSHLDAAYTEDLMNWTQISSGTGAGNTLFPDLFNNLSDAFAWSGKYSLWAPDVARLDDGRFYFYYCASEETSPRASIGIATSDTVEGPYTDAGIILQSGMWGQPSPDGTVYDPTRHPHCIDPTVFYDAEGRLQMVYGSYSGGIFIMELNPEDGTPLPGQGYGTHLWGGNHARIEGPYIIYHPDTEYYYLFVSYYGLAARDGYNIRVARSRDPHGPYIDSAGTDMAAVKGAPGTLFDDTSIAPHGVKLMGGYRFVHQTGEPGSSATGYLSPGHNSAYHDEAGDKYYLFFHTRFLYRGEMHQVRVHQIYFNEDGWPVVAPHRYAHETRRRYHEEQVTGLWKVINHGPKTIQTSVKDSVLTTFQQDGTISGAGGGTWELRDGRDIRFTLGGTPYRGVVSHQWDFDNEVWVLGFTALSIDGIALWGSKVAVSRTSLETFRLIHFGTTENAGLAADSADPNANGIPNLLEYALHADPNAEDHPAFPQPGLSGDKLSITFKRILDPALTYRIEADNGLNPASGLWSSTGVENTIGKVTVSDTHSIYDVPARFLRLKVSR